jgi:hypothetical protein
MTKHVHEPETPVTLRIVQGDEKVEQPPLSGLYRSVALATWPLQFLGPAVDDDVIELLDEVVARVATDGEGGTRRWAWKRVRAMWAQEIGYAARRHRISLVLLVLLCVAGVSVLDLRGRVLDLRRRFDAFANSYHQTMVERSNLILAGEGFLSSADWADLPPCVVRTKVGLATTDQACKSQYPLHREAVLRLIQSAQATDSPLYIALGNPAHGIISGNNVGTVPDASDPPHGTVPIEVANTGRGPDWFPATLEPDWFQQYEQELWNALDAGVEVTLVIGREDLIDRLLKEESAYRVGADQRRPREWDDWRKGTAKLDNEGSPWTWITVESYLQILRRSSCGPGDSTMPLDQIREFAEREQPPSYDRLLDCVREAERGFVDGLAARGAKVLREPLLTSHNVWATADAMIIRPRRIRLEGREGDPYTFIRRERDGY